MDFKVAFPDMSSAAAGCDSTAGEIQQKLATLRAYVISLEEIWKGTASTGFQELMKTYDNRGTDLHNALSTFAYDLRQSHDNYTGGETANVKHIDNIQENLGPANLS